MCEWYIVCLETVQSCYNIAAVLWLLCRFAFVDYDTAEEAAAAVNEHNNKVVDGRRLHVSPARSRGKSTLRKSFVLHLSDFHVSCNIESISLSLLLLHTSWTGMKQL